MSNKLRELIAKWRDKRQCITYETDPSLAYVEGCSDCADELEAALTESGAGQVDILAELDREKYSGPTGKPLPLAKPEPFDARALAQRLYGLISWNDDREGRQYEQIDKETTLGDWAEEITAAGQSASGAKRLWCNKFGGLYDAKCKACGENKPPCPIALAAPATASLSEEQVWEVCKSMGFEFLYTKTIPKLTEKLNALLRSQPAGTKGDGG